MTEIPGADRCVDWEICGLARWGGDVRCILHSSAEKDEELDKELFDQTFKRLLEKGRTKFQRVQFPHDYVIQNQKFLEELDLENTVFKDSGSITFRAVLFKKGLKLTSNDLGAIFFENGCMVEGPVNILKDRYSPSLRIVGVKNSTFKKDLTLTSHNAIMQLNFYRADFLGKIQVQTIDLHTFDANEVKVSSALDFGGCRIVGKLDLRQIAFSSESEVNLSSSILTAKGGMHIGDSGRQGLWLSRRRDFFDTGTEAIGYFSAPAVLHIDGLKVEGPSSLAGPDLGPPMRVKALTTPPQFNREQEVRIKNCDFSECCLLGNDLEKFKLINVQWQRWFPFTNVQLWGWYPLSTLSRLGRDILKDEILIGNNPSRNLGEIRQLRESYQILKEKYQKKGNQLLAGYFHYGEMEMRRHEQGWRHRIFSLDSFYWLLNGYGIGWGRALGILLAGTLIASGIYWAGDTNESCHNFFYGESCHPWSYWLRYSIKVGTFQRPELLADSEWSQWTQVIQTIWSPVQIGLLGLAIRMRVRR